MRVEYYKLQIDETSDNSLFNPITESFSKIEEVKQHLIDRYGKMPKGKNKVYIDGKDGKSIQIGFTHTFWNRDISHDTKNWRQTDWIVVTKVIEEKEYIDILKECK